MQYANSIYKDARESRRPRTHLVSDKQQDDQYAIQSFIQGCSATEARILVKVTKPIFFIVRLMRRLK